MKKNIFKKPEASVIRLEKSDIITVSGAPVDPKITRMPLANLKKVK